MVEALFENKAVWLSSDGPEADVVLCSRGTLARNVADLPFPANCSDDEKRLVCDRVLGAIEGWGFLSDGQYLSIQGMEPRERRFLQERQLVDEALLKGRGERGVCVSGDQGTSLMINAEDHLRMQVVQPGLGFEDIWPRLSLADDSLSNTIDFAFDQRRGYLTSSLNEIGTGLRLTAILHLPGLAMQNKVVGLTDELSKEYLHLRCLFADTGSGLGSLYELSNSATLGRSEKEVEFHLQHRVSELIGQERSARADIMEEGPRAIEDRVGRAAGVARGARLMDFKEGVEILQSIRLGRAMGQMDRPPYCLLNEMLIMSQRAHLEMRLGHDCDELTLSMERADLFRATFCEAF